MEGWAFSPRPSEEEAEEDEEARIERLEREALQQMSQSYEDIGRETDLLVKKIKKRSRKR
jgi:hypothetical protein